jgi:hypothetical protein
MKTREDSDYLIDALERRSKSLTVGLPVLHLPLNAELATLLRLRLGHLSRAETARLRGLLAAALDIAAGKLPR